MSDQTILTILVIAALPFAAVVIDTLYNVVDTLYKLGTRIAALERDVQALRSPRDGGGGWG